MKNHKPKNAFIKGAITTEFIANSIAKHQVKTSIGAHNIFLGQVRADEINTKKVAAIDYTAHEDMANLKFQEHNGNTISNSTFLRFDLSCMHIYHSIGNVNAGEICLFVFVSSKRRKEVFPAIEFIVEEIKAKVPIFGKEIFNDQSHQWKVNS